MKNGKGRFLFILTFAILAAGITFDMVYLKHLEAEYEDLDREHIEVINSLATAKIVHENLRHVRDLVFENMVFSAESDINEQEAGIFDFITTCVNDLKLTLISFKPLKPRTSGLVTTYSYDIELTGDFFQFGELAAKFENSRRIISLESFLAAISRSGKEDSKNEPLDLKMRFSTYRITKS